MAKCEIWTGNVDCGWCRISKIHNGNEIREDKMARMNMTLSLTWRRSDATIGEQL